VAVNDVNGDLLCMAPQRSDANEGLGVIVPDQLVDVDRQGRYAHAGALMVTRCRSMFQSLRRAIR
jgi:hypothetical protein